MKYYVVEKEDGKKFKKIASEVPLTLKEIAEKFRRINGLFCIEEGKMQINKLPNGIIPLYRWNISDEISFEKLLLDHLSKEFDEYIRNIKK